MGYLFQACATELCERYAQSLRVSVYAHDLDVLNMFIMSAFFMETTDVVHNTFTKVPITIHNDFTFVELNKEKVLEYREDVIELYRNLINHLRLSPVFYHCKWFLPIEDRFENFLSDDMRIFVILHNKELVGMIDSEPTDIDFAMSDEKAIGMGDVFIKPSYRGLGLGASLLAYANEQLKSIRYGSRANAAN